MKRFAINYTRATFIGILVLFCLPNLYAQSPCEGAAGPDREIFIDYPVNEINLDELLANNRIASSRFLVSTSWSFISGPIGPRGPRFVTLSEDDDVDFPNSGAGPDEEYIFEYTVTEDGCADSAIITIWVFISDPGYEDEIIYICPGETIGNANELFNAFSLSTIRDTEDVWVDSGFNEVSFPLNEGGYTFFDSSGNELFADVVQISCGSNNIELSFTNAQNTNDGNNDYYEVDIMIQTTDGSSFKLGDGKLFFQYNSAAFGEFISANSRIEVTQPDGYITGQSIDSNPSEKIYGSFQTLDNTNEGATDRVSWRFNQNYDSSFFSAENIDDTPRKLCHLKLTYIDASQPPFLEFADNEVLQIYDNQFTVADQISLIVNDSFINSGATLSNGDFTLVEDISLYPNPVEDILFIKGNVSKINTIEIYSITGREIMKLNNKFNSINISQLQAGVYFVKLGSENATKTIKIIKD